MEYQCINTKFHCNNDSSNIYTYSGSPVFLNQCQSPKCCPWNIDPEPKVFTCNITENNDNDTCVIKCDNIDATTNPYFAQIGCSNVFINGTGFDNLTVDCSVDNGCTNTVIECASNKLSCVMQQRSKW